MQRGLRSLLIDRKIVDHGLHGKRYAVLHAPLGFAHDGLHTLLGLLLFLRAEQEPHAAAAHATQHPEAPEISAELLARAFDQCVGIKICGPRNNALQGAFKILLQRTAQRAHVAPLEMPGDLFENSDSLPPAHPLGFAAQQVLLGDHFKNGTDILRHAAMDQHEALLQLSRESREKSRTWKKSCGREAGGRG